MFIVTRSSFIKRNQGNGMKTSNPINIPLARRKSFHLDESIQTKSLESLSNKNSLINDSSGIKGNDQMERGLFRFTNTCSYENGKLKDVEVEVEIESFEQSEKRNLESDSTTFIDATITNSYDGESDNIIVRTVKNAKNTIDSSRNYLKSLLRDENFILITDSSEREKRKAFIRSLMLKEAHLSALVNQEKMRMNNLGGLKPRKGLSSTCSLNFSKEKDQIPPRSNEVTTSLLSIQIKKEKSQGNE